MHRIVFHSVVVFFFLKTSLFLNRIEENVVPCNFPDRLIQKNKFRQQYSRHAVSIFEQFNNRGILNFTLNIYKQVNRQIERMAIPHNLSLYQMNTYNPRTTHSPILI